MISKAYTTHDIDADIEFAGRHGLTASPIPSTSATPRMTNQRSITPRRAAYGAAYETKRTDSSRRSRPTAPQANDFGTMTRSTVIGEEEWYGQEEMVLDDLT